MKGKLRVLACCVAGALVAGCTVREPLWSDRPSLDAIEGLQQTPLMLIVTGDRGGGTAVQTGPSRALTAAHLVRSSEQVSINIFDRTTRVLARHEVQVTSRLRDGWAEVEYTAADGGPPEGTTFAPRLSPEQYPPNDAPLYVVAHPNGVDERLEQAHPVGQPSMIVIPVRAIDPIRGEWIRVRIPKGHPYQGVSGSPLMAWNDRLGRFGVLGVFVAADDAGQGYVVLCPPVRAESDQ